MRPRRRSRALRPFGTAPTIPPSRRTPSTCGANPFPAPGCVFCPSRVAGTSLVQSCQLGRVNFRAPAFQLFHQQSLATAIRRQFSLVQRGRFRHPTANLSAELHCSGFCPSPGAARPCLAPACATGTARLPHAGEQCHFGHRLVMRRAHLAERVLFLLVGVFRHRQIYRPKAD